jgi:hypothetical protein
LAGVTLPDSYTVDGQRLVLNGMGLRTLTIFNVKVYVAGLYLPRQSHDAQQILASPGPKVILLEFVRSGSKAQVEKQYRAGEEANCGTGGCDPADQADFERLVAAAPAVNPGDTSTYIFTAKGVRVFANDRLIGDFANRDLAYHLWPGSSATTRHPSACAVNCWVSRRTDSGSIRTGSGASGLMGRLHANCGKTRSAALLLTRPPRLAHPPRLGDDVRQGHNKRGKTWSIW